MPSKPLSYRESAKNLQFLSEKLAPGEAVPLNRPCESAVDRAGMGLMALAEKAYGSVYDKERGKKSAYLLTARLLLALKKANPVLHLGDVLKVDSDAAVLLRENKELARVNFNVEQNLENSQKAQRKQIVASTESSAKRLGQDVRVIPTALATSDVLDGFGQVYKNVFVSTEISSFGVGGERFGFHKVQLLDFDLRPVSFFLHVDPDGRCLVLDSKGALLSKTITSSELLDPNNVACRELFKKVEQAEERRFYTPAPETLPIGQSSLEQQLETHFRGRIVLETPRDSYASPIPTERFSVFLNRPNGEQVCRYVLAHNEKKNVYILSRLDGNELQNPKQFKDFEQVVREIENS